MAAKANNPTVTSKRTGPEVRTVVARVPFSDEQADGGGAWRHVDLQLTGLQAQALQRLHAGLRLSGACMLNGNHTDRRGDALRWLLEQLAVAPVAKSP